VWRNDSIEDNLNPVWPEAHIPLSLLCEGDLDRNLKIEVMDRDVDADDSMGIVVVTTRELLESNGRTFPIVEIGAKKNSGVLVVENIAILELLWNPQLEVEYGALEALAEAVEGRLKGEAKASASASVAAPSLKSSTPEIALSITESKEKSISIAEAKPSNAPGRTPLSTREVLVASFTGRNLVNKDTVFGKSDPFLVIFRCFHIFPYLFPLETVAYALLFVT
jgi:hypothetical protein